MGYDLHFTRADHWPDSVIHPISLPEWITVADAEPGLTKHQEAGKVPLYEYINAAGDSWALSWRSGMITVWKGAGAAPDLATVAQKLGARLVGDDSEEYHPDGTQTPWTEPRPVLASRPLLIDEVAAAWEEIFDRDFEEGLSWRPAPGHALHALSAFQIIADRAVATADVDDADGLLYQYGPLADGTGEADGRRFRLSLVRQLAAAPDGALIQVECRLDYAMHRGLARLGASHHWWFPHEGPRSQWFETLAARPEWELFNDLRPLAVTFTTDATD